MGTPEDLARARAAWLASPDGFTGQEYAETLEASGQVEAALEVCAAMWVEGFIAGPSTAGVIEWSRGNIEAAVRHLSIAADAESDPEHRPDIVGRLGHLRWHYLNDVDAEPLLREGMAAYTDARSDLAELLIATDRYAEGRQTLVEGVEQGLLDCKLPLANLLDEEGDSDAAEQLYREAFAQGDSHSAWNLAGMLHELDRHDEADEWAWKAAQAGDDVAIRHLANDTDPPTP
jgi:tetratricopeptide (TPR) repeat protein